MMQLEASPTANGAARRRPGPLRPAEPQDAALLAHLVNLAGEGLPQYLWARQAAPGESPLEVGVARARRERGGFSYRNALVAETPRRRRGCPELAGLLLGYRQPRPYAAARAPELAPQLWPLAALEASAEALAAAAGMPGSWYLNALAVQPAFQGRGLGRRLLAQADRLAGDNGAGWISLIVHAGNAPALGLYRAAGYAEAARRPIVGWPGGPEGDWLLMMKRLPAPA